MSVPQRTSRLAAASVASALVFFLPVTTLLAVVLAVMALRSPSCRRGPRGRGLAVAGLLLGVAFTVAQTVVLYKGYRTWTLVSTGPHDALTVGLAGNPSAFRGYFDGLGGAGSNTDINYFADTLRARYGGLVECRPSPDAALPLTCPRRTGYTYVIQFTDATLDAEIYLAADENGLAMFATKLAAIHVIDPDRGDMYYPAGLELATAGDS